MKNLPFHVICNHLDTTTAFLVTIATQIREDAKKEEMSVVIDSITVIAMTLAALKPILKPELIEQMPKYLVELLRNNIQEVQHNLMQLDKQYAIQLRTFNNFSCWSVLVNTNEVLPLLKVKT